MAKKRKIKLYGLVSKFAQEEVDLFVESPIEVFEALFALFPATKSILTGGAWRMWSTVGEKRKPVYQQTLKFSLGNADTIHIMPETRQTGIEVGTAVLIGGLIIGASLAATFFLPVPSAPNLDDLESGSGSGSIARPTTRVTEGHTAAAIYGEVFTGIDVISTSVDVSDGNSSIFGQDSFPDGVNFGTLSTASAGRLFGGGGGKGGGESSGVSEDPDTLNSTAKANILALVGAGKQYGLVNGLQSIYINKTQVRDENGADNIPGVIFNVRTGEDDQTFIRGFESLSAATNFGTTLTVQNGPVVHTITNDLVDRATVTFQTPALHRIDPSNNSLTETTVDCRIEIQANGGGYASVFNPARFSGKTSSPYQRSYSLDLPEGGAPWDIRVSRITPDSDSASIQDNIALDFITEVVDQKFGWPRMSYIGIQINPEILGSDNPDIMLHWRGRICQIPENFDPATRTYDGVWDGNTFKEAWTDEPAWCFYDFATNDFFGAGNLTRGLVNKWHCYSASIHNSQMVPDGRGGMEHRHTMSMVIRNASQAMQSLREMAATFRANPFWGPMGLSLYQDRPVLEADKKILVPANVARDGIVYDDLGSDIEFSAATVWYNDIADLYEPKPITKRDLELIREIGLETARSSAPAAATAGEALRAACWRLEEQNFLSRMATVTVSRAQDDVFPGDVMQYHDPRLTVQSMGGLIASAQSATVNLDRDFDFKAGRSYVLKCMMPDGTQETRVIDNAAGVSKTVTLVEAFTTDPRPNAVWAIESDEVRLQEFRVLESTEVKGGRRLRLRTYDDDSWARVEAGVTIQPDPISNIPTGAITPVPAASISIQEYQTIDGDSSVPSVLISWSPSPDVRVSKYEVMCSTEESGFSLALGTNSLSRDIVGVNSGEIGIRVRALGAGNEKSTWAEAVFNLDAGTQTLPPVLNIRIVADNSAMQTSIVWDAPDDPRPFVYEIYRGNPDAANLRDLIGTSSRVEQIITETGDYFVQTAYMRTKSVFASITVTEADLANPVWDRVVNRPQNLQGLDASAAAALTANTQGVQDLTNVFGNTVSSAQNASASAASASASQIASQTAATAQSLAETARSAADSILTNVQIVAGNASSSAQSAETARAEAQQSAAVAEEARLGAETARSGSETARDSSAISETNAAGSAASSLSSANNSANSATQSGLSAQAASVSESSSSTFATEASQSAISAQTARSQAETARGAAEVAASQSAASQTTALGHATAAATSEAVSVQSANQALTEAVQLFPSTMENPDRYWTHTLTGLPNTQLGATEFSRISSRSTSDGPVLVYEGGPGNRALAPKGRFTPYQGQFIRLSWKARYLGANPPPGLMTSQLRFLDASGAHKTLRVGENHSFSAPNVWETFSIDLNVRDVDALAPYGHGFIFMNTAHSIEGDEIEILQLRIEDVTSVVSAESSAAASATSAASAALSETASSQNASASQTARTAAETALSGAQLSQTQAALSETNAQGASSAAAQSAGLASGSANAAGQSAAASQTSAGLSETRANEAGTFASAAESSAIQAATAEEGASSAATAAAASASSASASETASGQNAAAAQTAELNASTAASQAGFSAGQAAVSETNAAGSASAASQSAGISAAAESGALAASVASATSASNAAASETAAGQFASSSQTARTAAETAASQSSVSANQSVASALDATTQAGISAANALLSVNASVGRNLLENTRFLQDVLWTITREGAGASDTQRWRVGNNFNLIGERSYEVRKSNSDPTGFSDSRSEAVHVEAGVYYTASVYSGSHRCRVELSIEWYDANDNSISFTDSTDNSVNVSEQGGGSRLDSWKRIWVAAQAPSNARTARVRARKNGTLTGASSFMFLARPMFAEGRAEQTEPGPWSEGSSESSVSQLLETTATNTDNTASLTTQVVANQSAINATNSAVNITASAVDALAVKDDGGRVGAAEFIVETLTGAANTARLTIGSYEVDGSRYSRTLFETDELGFIAANGKGFTATGDGIFKNIPTIDISVDGNWMVVQGAGFGANNDLLYWFGANLGSPSNCTRQNGSNVNTSDGQIWQFGQRLGGVEIVTNKPISGEGTVTQTGIGANGNIKTVTAIHTATATRTFTVTGFGNATPGTTTISEGTATAEGEWRVAGGAWQSVSGTGAVTVAGTTTRNVGAYDFETDQYSVTENWAASVSESEGVQTNGAVNYEARSTGSHTRPSAFTSSNSTTRVTTNEAG